MSENWIRQLQELAIRKPPDEDEMLAELEINERRFAAQLTVPGLLVQSKEAPTNPEQIIGTDPSSYQIDDYEELDEEDEDENDDEEEEEEEDEELSPGDGDVVFDRELIYTHEYLGDEMTRAIIELHKTEPLEINEQGNVVALPQLRTIPKDYQLSVVTKGLKLCDGPNRGFIFADHMGLGKTLACGMLVMASGKTRGPRAAPALVVTTKTCMGQWRQELINHFEPGNAPRTLILRSTYTAAKILNGNYDFIITSYGFIKAQFRKLEKYKKYFDRLEHKGADYANLKERHHAPPVRPFLSVLSSAYEASGRPFPYLILDEAHYAKNLDTKTHKSLKMIPYVSVIAATGTPIPNRWYDIFGLIDFLAGHPFTSLQEFIRVFCSTHGDRDKEPSPTRKARLVKFLMSVMIGRPSSVLCLPGAQTNILNYEMIDSTQEDNVTYWTCKFIEVMKKQSKETMKSFTTHDKASKALVFAVLAQQHAAHPALYKPTEKSPSQDEVSKYVAMQRESWANEDPDSWKEANSGSDDLTIRKSVLRGILNRIKEVRVTRNAPKSTNQDGEDPAQSGQRRRRKKKQREDQDDEIAADAEDESPVKLRQTIEQRRKWLARVRDMTDDELHSARVRMVRDQCVAQQSSDAIKGNIIVFSKFLEFLDLIEEALKRQGLSVLRFHGSMTAEERQDVITSFKESDGKIILLITIGSGGAGMNLQAGSSVIRCEPSWTKAEEWQADCRVWRKGQTKPVFIFPVEVDNSMIDIVVTNSRDTKDEYTRSILDPVIRPDEVAPQIPRIYETY
ncbi:hypothetical protein KCU67_g3751, partial [Aureobasidium melanogenum]